LSVNVLQLHMSAIPISRSFIFAKVVSVNFANVNNPKCVS
jgi:hypothetical protein